MADTAIAITAGAGTNVDTRTEATNGNHRQVVVLGDPSTNAGVAPVDGTTGLSVNVTNATLTVGSHAVTNAGTFVVQENGTWVQVDDAAFTPATSKVAMVGAEFDDASPDSVDEGDGGAVRMSANRNLYVRIRDNAGNERGLNVDANGAISTTVASGGVASGAIASGAIASGAVASGAIASGAVASGAVVSGSIVDGAMVTIGAKADAKSTATDTTAITLMQVAKQISASAQLIATALGTTALDLGVGTGGSRTLRMAVDSAQLGTLVAGGVPTVSGGYEWETVAASQSDQAIGATGAAGDYIEGLLCVVTTAVTSQVQIKDGAGSAITVLPNSVGAGVGSYYVPLGLVSLSGAWKVTTAAGVSVVATGNFT